MSRAMDQLRKGQQRAGEKAVPVLSTKAPSLTLANTMDSRCVMKWMPTAGLNQERAQKQERKMGHTISASRECL